VLWGQKEARILPGNVRGSFPEERTFELDLEEKIGPERESDFFKVTQHFKAAELDLEFMSPAAQTTTYCFFFPSRAECYISQIHQTVNVLKSEFLSLLMSYSQYVWNIGDAQYMIVSVAKTNYHKLGCLKQADI